MKIDFVNKLVFFETITIGDVFISPEYKETYWMKMDTAFSDYNTNNAVNLYNGTTFYFKPTDRVIPVKYTFTVW